MDGTRPIEVRFREVKKPDSIGPAGETREYAVAFYCIGSRGDRNIGPDRSSLRRVIKISQKKKKKKKKKKEKRYGSSGQPAGKASPIGHFHRRSLSDRASAPCRIDYYTSILFHCRDILRGNTARDRSIVAVNQTETEEPLDSNLPLVSSERVVTKHRLVCFLPSVFSLSQNIRKIFLDRTNYANYVCQTLFSRRNVSRKRQPLFVDARRTKSHT